MKIAIVGGGAAGFFLAISLKELSPELDVTIYEKSSKVLSKVAVSGGGRCNLTNSFTEIVDISRAYPRGDKLMKRAFKVFNHEDAFRWFEQHGVSLITQEDQCVFPRSQNSQTIIGCFLRLCDEYGVKIKMGHSLGSIQRKESKYELKFESSDIANQVVDYVAITTGGNPNRSSLNYLEALGHVIEEPMPSLFTFNIPNDKVTELMGAVVENATVSLQGTKLKATGALLVTHWGMSGPAVLKLSSYAAKILRDKDYRFSILVNWTTAQNCDEVVANINSIIEKNPQKLVSNIRPYDLSTRHWLFLLDKMNIDEERRWGELGKKGINRIMNTLFNDEYLVHGRGSYRDEFVTCGGVSLDSVDGRTMESKVCEGLFFAGEVLDVDAITGGFNLQAAWTTASVAARGIISKISTL